MNGMQPWDVLNELGICAYGCLYILCPQYLKYCYIIISNVLVNFIPIIKSDGYYTAMTFLNKYNADNDKKKEFVDDFIRGAIMFGIMSVLSYLF